MAKATTQQLYQAECDPACGFLTRDHSEPELVSFLIAHCINTHGKTLSEKDARGIIRRL